MNAIILSDFAIQSNNKAKIEYINKNKDKLTTKNQCKLLNLSRSTYYSAKTSKKDEVKKFTEEEERAMQIIDKTHYKFSCYGKRRHRKNLEHEGIYFTNYHVKQLMDHMGIKSTAPQPSLSKPAKENPKYKYLLKGLSISHPNQVWATDITYIPLGHGHLYLSVVIDWFSRYIVGYKLHDTLEAYHCVDCVDSAIKKYGIPSIINSDQGATYSSEVYTKYLEDNKIKQSMDGRRRWADNVIIERWFRDLKHDCIYRNEYTNMKELKNLIKTYIENYNFERLHSSLNYETPSQWYFSGIGEIKLCA